MLRNCEKNRWAVLPDSGMDLLRDETSLALAALGFRVLRAHPCALADHTHEHYLPRLLEKKPDLFLSVNLQGLLPGGPHARALLESTIPALAWFVDNPWHILSGLGDPRWKNLTLAVTDKSFTAPLKAAGAKTVLHLPLAASPEHMRPAPNAAAAPCARYGVVFAGRSAFPNLENFFAGQEVPPAAMNAALDLLARGERPDFAWWVQKLDLSQSQENFWPGKKARRPGQGAALCNKIWRSRCLRAAEACPGGLTLFGDQGWQGIDRLRPPVDYYTQLPGIYRAASFSLNLNSLLLPGGLSQRIFDAWAAGGFCLTDRCAGLEIFPPELVRPVSFQSPEELPELAARLAGKHDKKERLRLDWQAHILSGHTYEKRLAAALRQMDLL